MSPYLTEIDSISQELADAIPKGWMGMNLAKDLSLDGRGPLVTYECEFIAGGPVEGGPVRRYHNAPDRSRPTSTRRVTVKASGRSIADLIAIAERLPSLKRFVGLPWPIDFTITTDILE